MPRLPLDDCARPLDLRLAGRMHVQQLRGVADRRERIAQLVREHREELVLALIHFLQRFFGLTARGDIEPDADDVTMPGVLHETGLAVDPAHAARGMPVAIFDLAVAAGAHSSSIAQTMGRSFGSMFRFHSSCSTGFVSPEAEHFATLGGEVRAARFRIPVPRADLRHALSEPQALFAHRDTPVGARLLQRRPHDVGQRFAPAPLRLRSIRAASRSPPTAAQPVRHPRAMAWKEWRPRPAARTSLHMRVLRALASRVVYYCRPAGAALGREAANGSRRTPGNVDARFLIAGLPQHDCLASFLVELGQVTRGAAAARAAAPWPCRRAPAGCGCAPAPWRPRGGTTCGRSPPRSADSSWSAGPGDDGALPIRAAFTLTQ